jgi:hypothetical protein
VPIGTCENPDCTIAATGSCLLSHPDPRTCPHLRPAEASTGPTVAPIPTFGSAGLDTDPKPDSPARTFHAGIELGTTDACEVMRARYTHLIGVLGGTGVGKTTFLTSLYLLASGGLLPDEYRFASCYSLGGFEDRARGLREWPHGILRAQLVDHTVLSDPRQPGLLHLGLREAAGTRRRFELLFTDLPGEWTESIIERALHAERLRFLQRADGIILVAEGPVLTSMDRHAEVQRMRHLADRLAGDVALPGDTPIVVLVSKGDEIQMTIPKAAEELCRYVESLGFPTRLVLSAAVARAPSTAENGTGVFDAVRPIIEGIPSPQAPLNPTTESRRGLRRFQAFTHRNEG